MNGYNFVYSAGDFYIPDGIPSPSSASCVPYFDPKVQIGGIAADVSYVAPCRGWPALANWWSQCQRAWRPVSTMSR